MLSLLNKLTKDVFTTIMFTTIALTLYYVFFGLGSWEGAIWHLSRQVERPIASYYHVYSYTPSAHGTAYLDMQLGCTVAGVSNINDLTGVSLINIAQTDMSYISYPAKHYSSGWN